MYTCHWLKKQNVCHTRFSGRACYKVFKVDTLSQLLQQLPLLLFELQDTAIKAQLLQQLQGLSSHAASQSHRC